ncbi:MAG TPA: hypothetical protein VF740_05710, partial [Candidatus Acidoferrum sp.]
AQEIVLTSYAFLKDLIVKNIEAEKPEMKPTVLAEMILTFFTGISMEQHLRVSKASMNQKVDDFMKVVRKLRIRSSTFSDNAQVCNSCTRANSEVVHL